MICRNNRGLCENNLATIAAAERLGIFASLVRRSCRRSRGRMFPNVRLMAASTIVSVMALFFAFGVYASLRVSHAPLARSSRAAPLQLVGFNVAMLPVTVLEPFADKHPAPAAADNSAALAYSAPQAAPPQAAPPQIALPSAVAPDAHADNAPADEPAENSDVTQMQITGALETAREPKAPERAYHRTALSRPRAWSKARPMLRRRRLALRRCATRCGFAANSAGRTNGRDRDDAGRLSQSPLLLQTTVADDADIVPKKKKKKKHIARRHSTGCRFAPSPRPRRRSSNRRSGRPRIGGPLVAAPKR